MTVFPQVTRIVYPLNLNLNPTHNDSSRCGEGKEKAESDDAELTLLGSRTGARKGGRGKEERAPANAQYRIC
jgi:hypothetical protein